MYDSEVEMIIVQRLKAVKSVFYLAIFQWLHHLQIGAVRLKKDGKYDIVAVNGGF